MPFSLLIFFAIVVAIPVGGGLLFSAFQRWLQHKERMSQLIADQTAEKAAQYANQVTALEDRVRVLERIVTDKGYDVATQIEALRDQRRVDEASSGVSIESLRKERA